MSMNVLLIIPKESNLNTTIVLFLNLITAFFFEKQSFSTPLSLNEIVENIGVEPMTSCVQGRRSSQLS